MRALQTQEIKVSRFEDLNDPFELYGVNLGNPDHRRKFRAFKNWVSKTFGLLCFSRSWQNPLLWSHYGDRHKGVALEFEIDDDVVEEVRYSPYRLRMDIEKALARGWFTEQEAHETAITKAIHWKYEDEVRVFLELSNCPERDGLLFQRLGGKLKIIGIVLGPLCELSKAEVQSTIPKGDRLQVVWSRLAFTTFNVVANKARRKQIIYGSFWDISSQGRGQARDVANRARCLWAPSRGR